MKRRELLEWISRGLAFIVTVVIGLPGIRYLIGDQSEASVTSRFTRLIRLKDLLPGQPMIVGVVGQKQDAWVRHEQQVIGQVWLVQQAGGPDADDARVLALSSVCPHMGCQVQPAASGKCFQCPCHKASFDFDGHRIPVNAGDPGPSPRDMDILECQLVKDETTGENWVEVKYERFRTGDKLRVPLD